jgi:hypothetical protein
MPYMYARTKNETEHDIIKIEGQTKTWYLTILMISSYRCFRGVTLWQSPYIILAAWYLHHSFSPFQLNMADLSPISFTTSNRNKPLVIYSGYIYRLKSSSEKVKYWTCISKGCTTNVHTKTNDQFIKAGGDHHHLPSPEQIELRNLKKKSRTEWKLKQLLCLKFMMKNWLVLISLRLL